jgi:hypothetical protein
VKENGRKNKKIDKLRNSIEQEMKREINIGTKYKR